MFSNIGFFFNALSYCQIGIISDYCSLNFIHHVYLLFFNRINIFVKKLSGMKYSTISIIFFFLNVEMACYDIWQVFFIIIILCQHHLFITKHNEIWIKRSFLWQMLTVWKDNSYTMHLWWITTLNIITLMGRHRLLTMHSLVTMILPRCAIQYAQ